MADVKWTKEQKAAIDTHDCNLLVAAAAGSGKTAVLVERIIKLVMDNDKDIDIDKLLVVTFTNAAASEMRERIGEALAKEINKESTPRLQRQLALLNRASITTIHSFCLGVIKNNFHETDLDPGFRVGDETEMLFLKQEAIDEIFDEKYKEDEEKDASNSEFLKLVETYCDNRSDNNLMELVLELYGYSMSMPEPEKWLKESLSKMEVSNENLSGCNWINILKREIHNELSALKEESLKALELINEYEEFQKFYNIFVVEHGYIQGLMEALEKSWSEFTNALKGISFDRIPTIRKCENPDIKSQITSARDAIKKTLNGYVEEYKNFKEEECIDDIKYMTRIMKALVNLVLEFCKRYKEKKRLRGIIDFNDFEHYCLGILVCRDEEGNLIKDDNGVYAPSKVALELRKKYDEILIDEYQDSNMVQEVILTTISKVSENVPNIFMVGDVKQSIYRFRQAKPEIFLSKYNTYSSEENELYRKIMLFKNFRSRKEILDGVNYIFEEIMSEEVGELNYTEEEALNLGADYKTSEEVGATVGGPIELNIIDKSDEDIEVNIDDEELEERPTDVQIEARFVAKRIRDLIDNDENEFKVFDKHLKEYRRVQYKDIVILLRSTSNWSPVFLEELKNYEVPVYADTSTGYFETIEIQTIMSLLKIIDNPRQDISLIAVLKSPIGGFTAEELSEIRIEDKACSYYDALLLSKDNNIKVQEFLEKLNIWREKSVYTPIDELIWSLYTETGYYGFVGALNNGVQRQANLKVLFQRAKKYEETSYKGLFNFINFIDKLNRSSGDLGSAKILGENENVVRIMSIHKSKGLEFPVVFLCGTGKQFNLMDLRKKILLHHELGFGPDYINSEKRIAYPTLVKKAISKKIKLETLSEEMRILYVALTRPKEKLIITGAVKDIPKYCENYSDLVNNSINKIPELRTSKAKSYLDWIVPAVMRHVNGEELRNQCEKEFDHGFNKHPSLWKINLFKKIDILNEEIEDKEEEELISISKCIKEKLSTVQEEELESYNSFNKEVNKKLNFKYKYYKSSKLPTVLTVTEVKRLAMEQLENEFQEAEHRNKVVKKQNTIAKKPKFLSEYKGLNAAEKGTAIHEVMQYLDLNRVSTLEEIERQVEELYMKEFISLEQAKVINCKKIFNFFTSYLGKEMLNNKQGVYREKAFNMEIPSISIDNELDKELYEDEKIIIQGIIDCYIDNDEGITLLDYKTDKVKDGNIDKIAERYRVQLDYYAKAIEIIMNKRVTEKYLYLFDVEKEVKL
ncbi:DNA helicase/exodeoxyribonuclease V, subunit A [Clostridium collagenovorans DSM 3089]|uniref:ATP-dependent helicase/nuclease subunit A n=1 Tax=Clostridium collagenovorans DSM 3089 TaxID=1121306 RepID=A0A1M5WWM7_9CLOT|nr:helicase-exonuclease AddAB subunit AddA [Clostridium collagenovorans]SHH92009.1 DNA helicase/exodeoxyribonuclease V, subunit A [Clostridium collagenovorans DSM 3089]